MRPRTYSWVLARLLALLRAPPEIQTKGDSLMEINPWNSHEWITRNLEIDPGRPLVHRTCAQCGRDFVDDLSSIERYAASVSSLRFIRLANEVNARWLQQPCPHTNLRTDDDDRKTRYGTAASSRVLSLTDIIARKESSRRG